MFEKVLAELRKLEGVQNISVPIHPDAEGYIDKECPDNKCLFGFKVMEHDWEHLFNVHSVFCPMCRHEAKKTEWYTTEQIKEGQQKVRDHFVGRINKAFQDDAVDFNARQPRNSFIKLSMTFTGSTDGIYILPLAAKEAMELKVQCRECNTRYAVIGSAFFCPCCGHNSAEETFANAVKKIEAKIDNLHLIKGSLASVGKDAAELTCRSLVETSLNDCVVAFQRFCEVSFAKKAPAVRVRMNAFQNLEAGAVYWQDLLGETYKDWITITEMEELKILFQRRHLLAHTEGMVDQKYIDNSGDVSYKVAQRIVVKESDVRRCLEIVQTIIHTLQLKI